MPLEYLLFSLPDYGGSYDRKNTNTKKPDEKTKDKISGAVIKLDSINKIFNIKK